MEDWTRGHIVLAAGALINSALYLSAVAAASYGLDHMLPMVLAIAAMGVAFLSYSWRLEFGSVGWVNMASLASQIVGTMAGLILLWEIFI